MFAGGDQHLENHEASLFDFQSRSLLCIGCFPCIPSSHGLAGINWWSIIDMETLPQQIM